MCKKCDCENNSSNWYIPLLMNLLSISFNSNKLPTKQNIIDEINRSDLSTLEKKQIMEILLN